MSSKKIAESLLPIGILLGGYALFFHDISVTTAMGDRVVNIQKMDDRSNMVIVAGVMIVVSVLLMMKKKEE